MFIDLTPEQRAFRDDLRAYFAELIPSDQRQRLNSSGTAGGPAYRELIRRLGRDGWLGIGWPKEHGGQGRGPLEQLIFFDEANRADVPFPWSP